MIRVLVASRSSLVRAALESIIRSSSSLEFGGTVDLGQSFSLSFSSSELAGDVILLETATPNDNDWQAIADLPAPTVVLLDPGDSVLVSAALRAGIRGAIFSDATPQEIEAAVQAVYAGLIVTAPAFVSELAPATQPIADELVEPLSERELEVLDLLAEGLSNKLLAHRLHISEHTVKTHVASIFAKLRVSSRTEAVFQAIRRGLVML